MAAHRIDFANDADLQLGEFFANGDRGPQARPAAADDENVVTKWFHRIYLRF
jgi:hypothetical protein